ncbi:response regulator transcription factor [Tumebacillus flagellatus]|uniref:Response regulator n=1 Tax=Tumebacillus flagellatus TaxID=1157490 RepID=A0A074LWA6_9BACL|nr:response regulator transcription factor [Tumebacillus flagellatus]KEO84875.1 response regulator [Tumebacillus flagellatus]
MKVLVVEDDRAIRHAVVQVLQDESYETDEAEAGDEGLLLAETNGYDLLILDIMMPGLDGLSLIKELRKQGIKTPALFLTAKDSVDARVRGLDAGADDYLVKPFAVEELLARIRALLRRDGKIGPEGELSYGPITFLPKEHDGCVQGTPLKLTNKEYELLQYMVQNREQILSRSQIFDRIWGLDSEANDSIVDLYIHYLRKKLAPFQCESMIRTVRGVGYMLKEA